MTFSALALYLFDFGERIAMNTTADAPCRAHPLLNAFRVVIALLHVYAIFA